MKFAIIRSLRYYFFLKFYIINSDHGGSALESRVFEFQLRQTLLVTSDSSIAKGSAKGVSVSGTKRCPLQTDIPRITVGMAR